MYPINPYSNVENIQPTTKSQRSEKLEVPTMTRSEIISSKELSPEQKMEKLGIKPWTTGELAKKLADSIVDGDL